MPKTSTSNQAVLDRLPPEKRAELERLHFNYTEALRRNPLWEYKPHPKQRAFHELSSRYRMFVGGNRSGKTTGSLADDLIQAVDEEILPKHLRPYKRFEPPFHCRIVAPKLRENHIRVTIPKVRELVPRDQLVGENFDKAFRQQELVLRFKNGSTFQFMTFDQDLDTFEGDALHRVHFDEEPEGEKGIQIYNANRMRLADYKGDFILSMTPLNGMSWSYDRFWSPVEDHETEPGVFVNGDIGVIQVDIEENPHMDAEEIEKTLEGFSNEERAARKSGVFIHFHGLVYGEFDDDRHLCDPVTPEFLRDKEIYVGIDPGLKRCAVVFCAFDGDNDMLVFDELYLPEPKSLPENAAEEIRSKLAWWQIKATPYFYIDPAARIRDQIRAEEIQTAYLRAGIPTIPAQNDVEPGCTEIKRRLQSEPHPALLVSKACQNWRAERRRYRFKPSEEGKFEVIKTNDHLMDATRYVAMARPWGAAGVAQEPEEGFQWTPGIAPHADDFEGQINMPSPPLGSMT